MGTATKCPVPDRVKQSFVNFDIRTLWRSALCVEYPAVKNYKLLLNPVWRSCTDMTTVGVKGLTLVSKKRTCNARPFVSIGRKKTATEETIHRVA